ncbi:MAG: MFS transporter [Rhizobiaceae bacterium]|nr:MFS transporter [Rhizobiaceae bacterium]
MLAALLRIIRDPYLRIPTLTLFVLGFTYASTLPYQSIIGINELGLSDSSYSVLIFAAAAINVSASVLLGILSDTLGDRRPLVLALTTAGVLGFGLIYVLRSAWIFIFCVLFLIPISNSTFSILFGSVRARTNDLDSREAVSVTSTVRAVYSGSWALMPGLVGLYLAQSQSMMPAYAVASTASLSCFCLYFFFVPRGERNTSARSQGEGGFLSSLARLLEPSILIRLGSMALITGTQRLSTTLSPLIITHAAHGTVVTVGFVSGGVAFLEMPFMLFWGAMMRRFHNVHVLIAGAIIYSIYLVLVSFATAPWHIYALIGINSCGAAAILCVPISYLQDLIADKPGLGSSLISVNLFLSGGVAAILFAIGTTISDYSGTALVGAASGLIAVVLMLALDSRRTAVVA